MTTTTFRCVPFFAIALVACLVTATPCSGDTLIATGSEISLVSSTGTATTFLGSAGKAVTYDAASQKIYFSSSDNAIKRADRDGTNVVTLVPPVGDAIGDIVIDSTSNRIVWTEYNNATIRSADLDGSNASTLVFGVSFPNGLYFDKQNSFIYIAGIGGIDRIALDGTGQTNILVDGFQHITHVVVEGGKLYWANWDDATVKRADLNGSNVETLASGANAAGAEGIDYNAKSGFIEFVGESAGIGLRKMRRDGTALATVGDVHGYDMVSNFTTVEPAEPIRPSLTRMYFGVKNTVANTSRIFYADTRKQTVPVVDSTKITSIRAMAYSAKRGTLYWADNTGPTETLIKRSDPDGNAIETFLTVNGVVNGLVADDTNNVLYATNNTARTVTAINLDDATRQEVLRTLSSVLHVFVDGSLSDLSSTHLTYIYTNTAATPNGYTALLEKTGSHNVRTVVAGANTYHGQAAYGGNRLAVMASNWFLIRTFDANGSVLGITPLDPDSTFVQRGIMGAQHLNPEVFDTPYAIYYGNDNGIDLIIPHIADPFRSKFLALGANEELKAAVEGPIEPVYPTPPTAPPTGTISGTVDVADDDSAGGTSTNGVTASASAGNIVVYLTPNTSDGSDDGINNNPLTQSTRTDSTGRFTFTNVADGDYTLTFRRSDLTFASSTLTVTPGVVAPPVLAFQRDIAGLNCTSTDRSSLIAGADAKAKKLVTNALGIAKKAYAKSKAKTALRNATRTLSNYHKNLIDISATVPVLQLSCSAPTTCTSASYKTTAKRYASALTKVKKQAAKVISISLKGNSTLQSKLMKLDSLGAAAASAATKLPIKSFTCPVETGSGGGEEQAEG
ncbi:MAG: hypothetical protein IT290_01895 [Deltaproteobacteria bacterium]|nr:hypothetical protein [Deltaproteobacteria bacterium]